MVARRSGDSSLSLWNPDGRRLWRRPGADTRTHGNFLAWSLDGKTLHVAGASTYGGIYYARRDTGATAYMFKDPHHLPAPVSVSPDEQHRAGWSQPGIDLWHGRERTPRAHIEVSTAWNIEAFSQDLTRMVARSLAGVNQVWDLSTGKQLEQLPQQVIGGYNSAWSPNLNLLAHVDGRNLQVTRTRDGSFRQATQLPKGLYALESGCWSPDGESLIVKGVHGTSSVVVALNSGPVTGPPLGSGGLVWGPSGAVVRLAGQPPLFVLQTPDRRWAAAVESESMLRIWDLSHDPPTPGPELRISLGLEPTVALSPDGKWIARISGPAIVIWDIAAGRVVERWAAVGSSELKALVWRDKLTAIDWLGGAVRLWQEH